MRPARHLQQLGLVVVAVGRVDPDAQPDEFRPRVLEDRRARRPCRPGRCGRRRPCPRTSRGSRRRRRGPRAAPRPGTSSTSSKFVHSPPAASVRSTIVQELARRRGPRRRSAASSRRPARTRASCRGRSPRARSSCRCRPRSRAPRRGACTSRREAGHPLGRLDLVRLGAPVAQAEAAGVPAGLGEVGAALAGALPAGRASRSRRRPARSRDSRAPPARHGWPRRRPRRRRTGRSGRAISSLLRIALSLRSVALSLDRAA